MVGDVEVMTDAVDDVMAMVADVGMIIGSGRNIGAMGTDHNGGGQGAEMADKGNNGGGGDHGTQHGHGFGHGAYCH
jgi:hypothetical protein